ncbi:MAG: hypothetical protein J0H25_20450 [Rhizobiales bacterium]|jgi:hypothetical protein|nr:hypothetical protein [Hyphomicrobiales bacterium]
MQDIPALMAINEQIDWVLARKDVSPWLKETLRTARNRDPIEILNDLEILNYLLRSRSDVRIEAALQSHANKA